MQDINVRAVVRFGGALLAGLIVIQIVLAWIVGAFESRPPEPKPIPSPSAESVYAQQRELLERTEWIDRGSGVVRIPIDRAIRLLSDERKK